MKPKSPWFDAECMQAKRKLKIVRGINYKYTRRPSENVFTSFVDYAKAFDSVCREAMLYKLWNMGINERYFKCIERMYTSSSAKIKLL